MKVHPTAVVHPSAEIHDTVSIGPYCVVDEDTVIGEGTELLTGVQVGRWTRIGKENLIYGPSTIGYPPQDLRFEGEKTHCEIGDHNTIREFVTIHRGTGHGGGLTRVENRCLIMAYGHIAHDCFVGDDVIFANAGTLAGHVEVGSHATVGAFSAVHQFCRVGEYAYLGGFTVATQDVLPYCKTVGSRPARVYGINTIGLERKGFSEKEIASLKKTFRLLFLSKKNLREALDTIEGQVEETGHVLQLLAFIRSSERGVVGR